MARRFLVVSSLALAVAMSGSGELDRPAGAAAVAPAAGMRVFLDPQTGRVIGPDQLPPQALSALEHAMLRRDSVGLVEQTLPNGAVVVHLQGRFHHLAVATLDPDGNAATTGCVTSPEAARSLLDVAEQQDPTPRDCDDE